MWTHNVGRTGITPFGIATGTSSKGENQVLATENLVYATSEDGLEHAGVIIRPAEQYSFPVPIVWVHGAGSNFYMRPYVALARLLAQRGYISLIGNNRGHDFGYFLGFEDGQPRYAGQGWEHFDQSPHDIAGWITFLSTCGFQQVVLLGHSLGAAKALYYQAHRQDARVLGITSASAPAQLARHSMIRLLRSTAERMLHEGRGQDLLPWASLPGGGTLSAQTYHSRAASNLDVYGLDSTKPLVAQITCPLLAFYGSEEAFIGGQADLEHAKAYAHPCCRMETCIIAGADHVYTDHEEAVAQVVDTWMRETFREQATHR